MRPCPQHTQETEAVSFPAPTSCPFVIRDGGRKKILPHPCLSFTLQQTVGFTLRWGSGKAWASSLRVLMVILQIPSLAAAPLYLSPARVAWWLQIERHAWYKGHKREQQPPLLAGPKVSPSLRLLELPVNGLRVSRRQEFREC